MVAAVVSELQGKTFFIWKGNRFMIRIFILFCLFASTHASLAQIKIPVGGGASAMNGPIYGRPRLVFGGMGTDIVPLAGAPQKLNRMNLQTEQKSVFRNFENLIAEGLVLGPANQVQPVSDPNAFTGVAQHAGEVGISIDSRTLAFVSRNVDMVALGQVFPVTFQSGVSRTILASDSRSLYPFAHGNQGLQYLMRIRIPTSGTIFPGVSQTVVYFRLIDSKGYGIWVGANIYDSRPGFAANTHLTQFDTANGSSPSFPIVIDPLHKSDVFQTSSNSMSSTDQTFNDFKGINIKITEQGFRNALARVRAIAPGYPISTDPKDFVLERWNLNPEVARLGGHGWIGLSAKPGRIGIIKPSSSTETCSMPDLDYTYRYKGLNKVAKLDCGCRANPAPGKAKAVGAGCFLEAENM